MSNSASATAEQALARLLHRPGNHRAACPKCDRGLKDTALAVRTEPDGGAVWYCHRCGWRGGLVGREHRASSPHWQPRAREWRLSTPAPPVASPLPKRPPEPRGSLTPAAYDGWTQCQPITAGTVAAVYLSRRRCVLPPPGSDLRWHPEVAHKPGCELRPALVGRVTDALTGEPISLHFTLLEHDGSGKAKVDAPRLLLPGHRKPGGVIRLWPDDEVTLGLVLGEGIETCLAAAAAGLTPVWATIDGGNLAAFPVLAGIEGLTVLVDHDTAGIAAAFSVIDAYQKAGFDPERDIKLIFPPTAGHDFNDLMVTA